MRVAGDAEAAAPEVEARVGAPIHQQSRQQQSRQQSRQLEEEEEERASMRYEWQQFEEAMKRGRRRQELRRRVVRPGVLFLVLPFLLLALILLFLGLAAGRASPGPASSEAGQLQPDESDPYAGLDELDYPVVGVVAEGNNASAPASANANRTVGADSPLTASIINPPTNCPKKWKKVGDKCRRVY